MSPNLTELYQNINRRYAIHTNEDIYYCDNFRFSFFSPYTQKRVIFWDVDPVWGTIHLYLYTPIPQENIYTKNTFQPFLTYKQKPVKWGLKISPTITENEKSTLRSLYNRHITWKRSANGTIILNHNSYINAFIDDTVYIQNSSILYNRAIFAQELTQELSF